MIVTGAILTVVALLILAVLVALSIDLVWVIAIFGACIAGSEVRKYVHRR